MRSPARPGPDRDRSCGFLNLLVFLSLFRDGRIGRCRPAPPGPRAKSPVYTVLSNSRRQHAEVPQLKGRGDHVDGVVQRSGKFPAALRRPDAVPSGRSAGPRDYSSRCRRPFSGRPPRPPDKPSGPGGRASAPAPAAGQGRPPPAAAPASSGAKVSAASIHGGAALSLQRRQTPPADRRTLLSNPGRTRRSLPVGRAPAPRRRPGTSGPAQQSVVRHAVPQLPIGQNHALVRRQLQGRRRGLIRPAPVKGLAGHRHCRQGPAPARSDSRMAR